MITPFTMYLITRLDGIKAFTIFLMVISAFAVAGLAVVYLGDGGVEEFLKTVKKYIIVSLCVFVLSGSINLLLPTTKEAIIIFGVPALVNNSRAQNIGDKSLKLIENYLDEQLKDQEKREE